MTIPIARPSRRWRWLLAASVLVPMLVGAVTAGWIIQRMWVDRSDTPDIEAFIQFDQPTTTAIYAANGPPLIELARQHRELVDYAQIPPVLRDALLVAEDKHFFTHYGVDPAAWPRVLWRNLGAIGRAAWRAVITDERVRVTFRQGGSTITQQLVRGLFLQHLTQRENSDALLSDNWLARIAGRLLGAPAANKLARKVEEVRLALWLEETLTERVGSRQQAKEMIFAHYANLVYFGRGRYGVAAASRYYFDKPLHSYGEDDAAEAALLAGIIKNPRDNAPTPQNIEASRRRRDKILTRMWRSGRLDAVATRRAQAEPIEVAAPQPTALPAPAAVASVFEELRQGDSPFGVEDLMHGRVRVYTSVDTRLQRIADEAVENGLQRYERRHPRQAGLTQAAVVMLRNADAAILAEVGGRRFYAGRAARHTDYNRASHAVRQPGSAFKPLVYLAALRAGATLDSLVLDDPIDVPSISAGEVKAIANYDRTFRGPIRLREALAESRNAATVWIAREIGMPPILSTARALGIRTPLKAYLSTALGASEVTLRELANSYRALASGVGAEPHVIEHLENARRERVYETAERGRPLHIPELLAIQEGLRGVVRLPGGTARGLAERSFPVPVLGKTGTSSDFRDALFVGSTYGPRGITVAVWVGRDDFRSLGGGESGARVALPIFRDIMLNAYRRDVLGLAPPLLASIDQRIDDYLARAALQQDDAARRPGAATDLGPGGGERILMGSETDTPAQWPTSVRDFAPPLRPSTARAAWLCSDISSGTVCLPKASVPAGWLTAGLSSGATATVAWNPQPR